MDPDTPTRHTPRTSLRPFVLPALVLHGALLAVALVPGALRLAREARVERAERAEREAAREDAAEEVRRLARESAAQEIREVLRQDAHELLDELLEPEEVEEAWQSAWEELQPELEAMLDQLDAEDYAIPPDALEAMLTDLRAREVEALRDHFEAPVRERVASNTLHGATNNWPAFEAAFLEGLEQRAPEVETRVAQAVQASVDASDPVALEAAMEAAAKALADLEGAAAEALAQAMAEEEFGLGGQLAAHAAAAAQAALEQAGLEPGATGAGVAAAAAEAAAAQIDDALAARAHEALTGPMRETPGESAGGIDLAGLPGGGSAAGQSNPHVAAAQEAFDAAARDALREAAAAAMPSLDGGPAGGADERTGLLMRLQAAAEAGGRRTTLGVGSAGTRQLTRTMEALGAATRSARRSLLGGGERTDLAAYERNIADVIEERDNPSIELLAPPATGPVARAATTLAGQRSADILVAAHTNRPARDAAAPRDLHEPHFKTFAYGGAVFAETNPTLDGALDDWSHVEPFALRATRKNVGPRDRALPESMQGNRLLMTQWNNQGFYCAYRMVDERDNTAADQGRFWENDSLELWFDFANRRADNRTPETYQFWFWPLGSALGPDVIGGSSTGWKFTPRFRRDAGPGEPRMAVRRTEAPRGYAVELFLPHAVLGDGVLAPGRVIAFNFSINNGEGDYLRWSVNLGRNEARAPSLWGDLVLLGTDAQLRFTRPDEDAPLLAVLPGEPVGLEVADADRNRDPRTRERIDVQVGLRDGTLRRGALRETGPDTGVFRGSVDSVRRRAPDGADATANALAVRPGETVVLLYEDLARRHGERYHIEEAELQVGLPVYTVRHAASTL